MLNSRCAMLLGLCMKPWVSSCQGMNPCGAYGASSDGSHGHNISGSSADPSSSCKAKTAQLAISRALVTGGRLVNIGAPARTPMITAEACRAGRCAAGRCFPCRSRCSGARSPQHGVQVIGIAARHAHAALLNDHAFSAQAPHLLTETRRTGRERDLPVAAQDAV